MNTVQIGKIQMENKQIDIQFIQTDLLDAPTHTSHKQAWILIYKYSNHKYKQKDYA